MGQVINNTSNKKGKYLKCPICGNTFYRKPSQIQKCVDINNLTCSKKCSYELKKTLYKGNKNHQYGLKGELNSSFKSNIRKRKSRYTEVRCPEHPFKNSDDMICNYILVAEKYLLNDQNSITINGIKYLNPKCVVHHIDFNKENDKPTNLYIFPNKNIHLVFHILYKTKHFTINEFWEYYNDKYVSKIQNYKWLYKAYITYNLSILQINKIFDIPYKAISTQIDKFGLKEEKINYNQKRIALITKDLGK